MNHPSGNTKSQAFIAVTASAVAAYCLYLIKKPKSPVISEGRWKALFRALPNRSDGEVDIKNLPHKVRLNKARTKKVQEKKIDVIIIGSGLGGLTVASLLSQRNYNVLVLEQHDQAGGCLHTFEEKGYEFDVGLHYVGGQVGNRWSPVRKMFDAVTGGRVEWNKLDEPYDAAIFGEDRYEFRGDYNATREMLKEKFADCPSDVKAIEKFYRSFSPLNLHIRLAGWFISKTLGPFLRKLLSPLLTLPARGLLNVTTEEKWQQFGASDKLIAVMNYLYGDYGLEPAKSCYAVGGMVFQHWEGGAFYPEGGSSALAVGACEVVAQNGGNVLVNARVEKIIVESGKAVGVQLTNGTKFFASKVVSDAGARNTFLRLLDEKAQQHINEKFMNRLKIDKAFSLGDEQANPDSEGVTGLSPSCALMTLFVGLNEDCSALGIPATNIWKSAGYRANQNMEKFRNSRDGFDVDFPVIFFGSNSAKDRSYESRFGKHRGSIMVLAPVNYGWFKEWNDGRVHARGKGYEKLKERWEKRLLEELYNMYPKCRGHVAFKDLGTPLSNNYYLGVREGEVYGLSHSVERFWDYSDDLSPATDIAGLYISGQDILSAGIAGALSGGLLCMASISNFALASHVPNII